MGGKSAVALAAMLASAATPAPWAVPVHQKHKRKLTKKQKKAQGRAKLAKQSRRRNRGQ